MNRKVLGKSVVSTRAIRAGERITADMLAVKSPAHGLSPQRMLALIGRAARRDVAEGKYFFESDLADDPRASRRFTSPHRWGLIVRYHDMAQVIGDTQPRAVEFHFSSHDLTRQPELPVVKQTELIVHAPELYGDQLLDLCARDGAARRQSIANAQSAIDVARRLKRFFPDPHPPVEVVVHVVPQAFLRMKRWVARSPATCSTHS